MSIYGLVRIAIAAAAIAVVAPASSYAGGTQAVRNIVIVHGAWADGSGWQDVHGILRGRGYNVSVVQNPLTSLEDDVAATARVLARQDGPVLLVGHSYGGIVITEVGRSDNVVGLVYVAAFVPGAGESLLSMIAGGPEPPVQASSDGFLFFDPAVFPQAFAQDLSADRGAFLADSQAPAAVAAFSGAVGEPAWQAKSSWYVVATDDHIIPPDAQRQWAARAGAMVTEVNGSHFVFMSQPEAVADAIDRAAAAAVR